VLEGLAVAPLALRAKSRFDAVIRRGLVVDGTGLAPYTANSADFMILLSAEAQDGGRDAMLARLRDAGWVKDESTFDQPHPCASGIPHVMVNGVLVAEAGRHTGAKPVRALRRLRGRPSRI
jgi:N-acyl-D-aspartate/D-glutamate deacylase